LHHPLGVWYAVNATGALLHDCRVDPFMLEMK
jgi:hypothetical protein